MKKLARQPSLDCAMLAVDKMGIQQSLSRNGNFCPGPRLRDKGYRNENGDRIPQRSDADCCRCAKIPRVMQVKWNRSNAPEMEKDQTPMLWDPMPCSNHR
jgi:hypothetical protein